MKTTRLFFIPPLLWLIISTFLLTIPGTSFPKENWLDKIWLDKWIHIGMFTIMVFLWCRAIRKLNFDRTKLKTVFILLAIVWLAYGTGMEFVQKYFIPNRGFDIGDILADGIGCIVGLVYSTRRYIKKLTPVETGVATKTNCL
ncbi:MAG: VanZ family protein [Chitinophagaceae bacterium]|nr:VanZ family protein [Chitinophagaceae bacterium]